ncbi:hypothetical protein ISF6_3812 [Piscinibacter sakaiensis]|uniref:Uncharacterized protein n=1 Tax=Piscinibacter sakaiensis TaxID=1547922 RepID=A0A0K8P5I2_PISS1|nr:hypothetical protein ISF6_3812 [Piscinibacter sakaiensis]
MPILRLFPPRVPRSVPPAHRGRSIAGPAARAGHRRAITP